MEGGGFMDGINLDYFGDLFDHIDDLLDFPTHTHGGGCEFQGVWQDAALFSSTQLSVPDIAQLEWLPTFVEDSFSPGTGTGSITTVNNEELENNNHASFQTQSPVSVVETSTSSSSSCSGGRTMPVSLEILVPCRPRSKRPRPATFISPTWSVTDSTTPLVSPTCSFTDTFPNFFVTIQEFDNFAESTKSSTTQEKKKKSKPKSVAQPMGVRKCLHCEITKTPQWRAGPLGPKTLCNACGVRYKSGRLFPEYRPAASPTFVPKLHSNSHKKVIEMRGNTMPADEALLTDFLPSSRLWDEYM